MDKRGSPNGEIEKDREKAFWFGGCKAEHSRTVLALNQKATRN